MLILIVANPPKADILIQMLIYLITLPILKVSLTINLIVLIVMIVAMVVINKRIKALNGQAVVDTTNPSVICRNCDYSEQKKSDII